MRSELRPPALQKDQDRQDGEVESGKEIAVKVIERHLGRLGPNEQPVGYNLLHESFRGNAGTEVVIKKANGRETHAKFAFSGTENQEADRAEFDSNIGGLMAKTGIPLDTKLSANFAAGILMVQDLPARRKELLGE